MNHLLQGNVKGLFRPGKYGADDFYWRKYAGMLPAELPDGAAFEEGVYLTILHKACSTNKRVDWLCSLTAETEAEEVAEEVPLPAAKEAAEDPMSM